MRALCLWACLVLMLVAGCGGTSRRTPTLLLTGSSQETDLGLEELRKSLESTVLENYAQLGYGNIEAFADGVASDRELLMVGVTPRDVLTGPNPPGLLEDRRLYRHRIKDGLRILSKNLDVHLSADGSIGWIYDEISYRITYMGREASIPIRVTAVFERDVERWVLVAEHMSYGVAIRDIVSLKSRGKLVGGRSYKTSYGTSKELSAYLVGLIGRFVNTGFLGDRGELSDEVLVLLPSFEDEFHSADAASATSLARRFGDSAKISVREIRMQISASKRMAWAVANLTVHTELNGDELEIPLRASFVLERRRDKDWVLMQAHVSAGLLERQLSEFVFGPNE